MTFLDTFKHLLPNAKAWRLTVDKNLRRFFEGLTGLGSDIREYVDDVWLDIFPVTTREIDAWENQFGLTDPGLTTQERRDRLDAAWKALGGQDPRYIQDTLQNNGFNVFVHEWWDETLLPTPGEVSIMRCSGQFARCGEATARAGGIQRICATPRNPLLFLRSDTFGPQILMACGEVLAECGEVTAEAGGGPNPLGYPLVNKVFVSSSRTVECGEDTSQCGEPFAECGNAELENTVKNYTITTDESKWPYFLYLGGETFPDLAVVETKRRDEFETLCLKICPAQQWLGILVTYS